MTDQTRTREQEQHSNQDSRRIPDTRRRRPGPKTARSGARIAAAALAGALAPAAPAAAQEPAPWTMWTGEPAAANAQAAAPAPAHRRRAAAGLDIAALEAAAAGGGARNVRLGLLDGTPAVASVDYAATGDGVQSWGGRLEGGGQWLLTHDGERTRGTVTTAGGVYALLPREGGGHVLLETAAAQGGGNGAERSFDWARHDDRVSLAAERLPPDAERVYRHPDAQLPVTREHPAEITLLIVYTLAADGWLHERGIDAWLEAQHLTARMNMALAASETHTHIRLAGIRVTTHTEQADTPARSGLVEDLLTIAAGQTPGAREVHEERERVGADLVHLITGRAYESLTTLGAACAPTLYAGFDRACGFSASEIAGNVHTPVMTHELGHNFGLNHDRWTQARIEERAFTAGRFATPETYSYGWVNPGGLAPDAPAGARWRTAMAYDARCWLETEHIAHELHGVCRMLNRFSNPALAYRGAPTGRAGERETGGIDGPADAARAIRRAARLVELYTADRDGGRRGDQGLSIGPARVLPSRVRRGETFRAEARLAWRGIRIEEGMTAEWQARTLDTAGPTEWITVQTDPIDTIAIGENRLMTYRARAQSEGRHAYRACVRQRETVGGDWRCSSAAILTVTGGSGAPDDRGCELWIGLNEQPATFSGRLTGTCGSRFYGGHQAHRVSFTIETESTVAAEVHTPGWRPLVTLAREAVTGSLLLLDTELETTRLAADTALVWRRVPAGRYVVEIAGSERGATGAWEARAWTERPEGRAGCRQDLGSARSGLETAPWEPGCRAVEAYPHWLARSWSLELAAGAETRLSVLPQESTLPVWFAVYREGADGRSEEYSTGWTRGAVDVTLPLGPGRWLLEVTTHEAEARGSVDLAWSVAVD